MKDNSKQYELNMVIHVCLTLFIVIGSMCSVSSHDLVFERLKMEHEMETQRLKMENETVTNMFHKLVDGIFEHSGHWKEVNKLGEKWSFDTSSVLNERVNEQVNIIENILGEALPGNQVAIKSYMPYYFTCQCDHLKSDFEETPRRLLTKLLFYPSQYWATVAYLKKANEMGIEIDESYLKFYTENKNMLHLKNKSSLESCTLKSGDLLSLNKPVQPAKNIPAPPPLTSKATWTARPYKGRASTKEPSTKQGNSSISSIVDIIRKKDYVLKSVSLDPSKREKKVYSNPLEEILRNRFQAMRPALTGMQ